MENKKRGIRLGVLGAAFLGAALSALFSLFLTDGSAGAAALKGVLDRLAELIKTGSPDIGTVRYVLTLLFDGVGLAALLYAARFASFGLFAAAAGVCASAEIALSVWDVLRYAEYYGEVTAYALWLAVGGILLFQALRLPLYPLIRVLRKRVSGEGAAFAAALAIYFAAYVVVLFFFMVLTLRLTGQSEWGDGSVWDIALTQIRENLPDWALTLALGGVFCGLAASSDKPRALREAADRAEAETGEASAFAGAEPDAAETDEISATPEDPKDEAPAEPRETEE